MTLVKIAKQDRDAVEFVCITYNVGYSIFTIEHNTEMLLLQVDSDVPAVLFHLGRMVELKKEQIIVDEQIKKLSV